MIIFGIAWLSLRGHSVVVLVTTGSQIDIFRYMDIINWNEKGECDKNIQFRVERLTLCLIARLKWIQIEFEYWKNGEKYHDNF